MPLVSRVVRILVALALVLCFLELSVYAMDRRPPEGPEGFPNDPDNNQYGTYEEVSGRLWRSFRDGEMSEDEYKDRMDKLNDAKTKYDINRKKLWGAAFTIGSESFRVQLNDLNDWFDGRAEDIEQGTGPDGSSFGDEINRGPGARDMPIGREAEAESQP